MHNTFFFKCPMIFNTIFLQSVFLNASSLLGSENLGDYILQKSLDMILGLHFLMPVRYFK